MKYIAVTTDPLRRTIIQSVFALSYMYYSALGTFITVAVGTLVSWLMANENDVCDDKMLNPYFVTFLNYLRDRKKPPMQQQAPISSIESEFAEQINYGYDGSRDGSAPSLNRMCSTTSVVLELESKETYRKIIE